MSRSDIHNRPLPLPVNRNVGSLRRLEAALQHWYVTGLCQQGAVPSLVASVGDSSSSLLSVVFEVNPEQSSADQLLRVHSQPVEITYDAVTFAASGHVTPPPPPVVPKHVSGVVSRLSAADGEQRDGLLQDGERRGPRGSDVSHPLQTGGDQGEDGNRSVSAAASSSEVVPS